MHKNCLRLALIVLAVAIRPAPVHGADEPTTAPATAPSVSPGWIKLIDQSLSDLVDGSDDEKQLAEDRLLNAPGEAVPLIEQGLKRPGMDAESRQRVVRVLNQLRQVAKIAAEEEARHQQEFVWNQDTMLKAYDRCGSHDPKWDDLARQAIRQFTSRKSDERDAGFAALEHITSDLHCHDPLMYYLDARDLLEASEHATDPAKKAKWFNDGVETTMAAADRMDKSDYPADRKCLALARAATVVMSCGAQNDPKLKADAEKWADDSLALLTAAVKVPGEPERFLTDIADLILTAQIKFGADRGLTVDKLYAALDGAFPNRAAWLVFKGHQYMLWAWDARGMGYANTVTPQGWRLMAQRLDLAEAALTKAYELDPSNPAAAVEMLAVVMGQNKARDVMEQWFQRAITADPDSLAACQAKLLYLEPKWHGSAEEMLAFGRQCLATRNWRGGIANMLIIAHMQLASYASNKEAYWHDPKVWDDISAVAARCVELHPENTYHRSVYAYWAWKCGRWDIANYQFKQLGDKVDLAVFGNNPAELARAKAESVANASVK